MDQTILSQRIVNYAIWYYCKYYPSTGKLKQKLLLKFGPESENGKRYGGITDDDIEYIFTDKMRNILCEKEVIDAKIRNLTFKGKSKQYIQGKLFEKGFKKEDFQDIIESYYQNGENEILKKEICKSLKILDFDQVYLIINSMDFTQKNKIIQRLIRKGFQYQDIKELFSEQ